jgi:hypothetical protein
MQRQEHQQLHHPRAQAPGHLNRHLVHSAPGDTPDPDGIWPTKGDADVDVVPCA